MEHLRNFLKLERWLYVKILWKINLDVDIKTFIRTILRHSLVGVSSIRGICVIHKHNSEVEFLHFSTINI